MKKENQPQKALHLDGQYPGLNTLSYGIGFLEQLLAIISEPLLIGCAVIAVIDFVTGGRLLALPLITYTWAASLGIAVSACFIVTWRRAIRAFTLNYYGVAIGLALLGLVLGVVDWTAIDVQSLQQTLGTPFGSALAQLDFNIVLITHLRSAVAIAMAVVVAVSNHTAVTTAQAPKRRLVFLERVLNQIAPVVSSENEQSLPPVQVKQLPEHSEKAVEQPYEHLVQSEREQMNTIEQPYEHFEQSDTPIVIWNGNRVDSVQFPGKAPVQVRTLEQQVRTVLIEQPGISVRKLAEQLNIPASTANYWIKRVKAEQEQAS